MNKLLALLVLVFIAAQSAIAADTNVIEKPLVATALDTFNQQAAQIRKDMQPQGRYQYITSRDKDKVETRLGDIQRMLQAHASASDLSTQDKVAMVNAQEEVNATLRHNDENRLVCEHKSPMGSHIPVTSCVTYAQAVLQREHDQKTMTDIRALNRDVPNTPSH